MGGDGSNKPTYVPRLKQATELIKSLLPVLGWLRFYKL